MKKIIIYLCIIICISTGLIGCANQKINISTNEKVKTTQPSDISTNENQKNEISINKADIDVRELAYNQLTSNDKRRILGNWKDGKLSKIVLKEFMGSINDKAYIGKEVYTISFPTETQSYPNNMIVFLGMDNNKLIGYGYVD